MRRAARLLLIILLSAGPFIVASVRAESPATPAPAAPAVPEAYLPGLKALLEAAVRQSPRMIVRNTEEAVAEANRTVARAGRLPTVSGSMVFNGWQRDDRADLPEPTNSQKLTYGLNLVQPLYHWGALQNNARIGELQVKASQGQTAEAYRLLVQEIRSLYLQLVIRKTGLARARFNRDLQARQLQLAEEKLKARVISDSEVYYIRMNLTQANLATDRTQEDYESATRTLAKLSGTAPLTDELVPDAIPAVAAPLAELEQLLGDLAGGKKPSTASLRVLHEQIEIEQLTYRNATTRLKPKLSLIVGLAQDEQSYTSNIAAKYRVQSYFVGTQVTWSIFDGFASRGMIAGSLARRRQLEQNYRDMSADLAEQARSQLKQLGFSARTMEITDQYLSLAENGVRVRRDDLGRGQASQADVDAARLGLLDAQAAAYNNRLDFLMRMADLLSTLAKDPALANSPGPNP